MKTQALPQRGNIDIQEINLDLLLKEMAEWSNRVAQRAYEYFAASGFTNGHDLDDWFKAERDLLKPVALDVADAGDKFVVTAEVPGFNAEDLDISVNGRHLSIEGNHETVEDKKAKDENIVCHERGVAQIYRVVELPAAILGDQAHGELRNGILELKLPKAGKPKQIKIAAA